MDVFRYLHSLAERKGSDLFFSVGAPVNLKREGRFHQLTEQPLPPGSVKQLAYQPSLCREIYLTIRTCQSAAVAPDHDSCLQPLSSVCSFINTIVI